MLILYFSLNAKNQGMVDLYKYVIEDCYNESVKNGYLSKQDTLYLIWNLCGCDCREYYFDDYYDDNVQLNNDKIQFKMPNNNENYSGILVYKLGLPEVEGSYISISLIPFGVTYNKETKDLHFVRASTIIYIFKYNRKKSKYECKSKKEYAI